MSEDAYSAPRVSVVIIFFNCERYLAEAIESVRRQSFEDWELILVDDGSSDRSAAIARTYAQREPRRVRYCTHPGGTNRGMSASRNLGIRQARGELLALLDADDVWAPNKLAEQVAIMDAHPTVAMVCGAVRYWRSWAGGKDWVVRTGHIQDAVVPPPEAALSLYPLGTAAAPCPSDLLLRRSTALAVGGFEEHFTGALQLYEDQGFLVKLYLAAPVYFAADVWLDYRQHPGSCMATVKRDGQYPEVRLYFLRWLARYLAASQDRQARVEQALARALWRCDHPLLHGVGRAPARAAGMANRAWQRLRTEFARALGKPA